MCGDKTGTKLELVEFSGEIEVYLLGDDRAEALTCVGSSLSGGSLWWWKVLRSRQNR
jgi:hypothetical protein